MKPLKSFKCAVTVGELYRPAMEIIDQAEADAYFEALVKRSMLCWHKTREEAEALERGNLGYFAGYYDRETMERVNRLYRTQHPIFGGAPPATPEQAIAAGQLLAAATSPTTISNNEAQAAIRTLLTGHA